MKNGGAAFPNPERVVPSPYGDFANDKHYPGAPGMSLRDWFAGQALCGILGNRDAQIDELDAATSAYIHADAMLAEREKGGSACE